MGSAGSETGGVEIYAAPTLHPLKDANSASASEAPILKMLILQPMRPAPTDTASFSCIFVIFMTAQMFLLYYDDALV